MRRASASALVDSIHRPKWPLFQIINGRHISGLIIARPLLLKKKKKRKKKEQKTPLQSASVYYPLKSTVTPLHRLFQTICLRRLYSYPQNLLFLTFIYSHGQVGLGNKITFLLIKWFTNDEKKNIFKVKLIKNKEPSYCFTIRCL